ncbi:MAG: 50S ribosomal protein L20 [Nitrospinae bacterium]|nr:50S ribosomal protein L20 [Nitrospinota bacterium]
MPRAVSGVVRRKRRNKILKQAKGFRGAHGSTFRKARESVNRALNFAYSDRRVKKRNFRSLWIARISAAAHMEGMNYSQFMHAMKTAGIDINRKMLSEMAIHDPSAFKQLAGTAKKQLAAAA